MPCPSRNEFQIGWICALPIEAAAAKEMLDENFGVLDEQDTTDSNIYTLGRIGKHHVVIACLPAGQYGNIAATTVANNMVRTFSKSLRVGLMVGVGGGIPSTAHDIRLGDIVISCPTGTCGGVLQYDMGKVGVDGTFSRTGSLNSPPRALLTAINAMRTAELTDEPCYPGYLQSAIRRTVRTRKTFARPVPQSDRLFQAKHDHPATVDNCDACLEEWEETRSEREDYDPQTHYGIIASGNAVIKHGWTREELRLKTDALCFEMEAAGLMLDFPCIVIRGICDYSDSHKNKLWQGYAALAAASYTKELLGYMPRGQISQETLATDVCRSIENVNEEIKGTNQRLDRVYNQQEQYYSEQTARVLTDQQRRCHQVFKTSSYEQHKDINPNRVPGTCQWALQNPCYLRWWDSCCNDLLWISADPGCGKSVLAKSLIDDDFQACSSTVSVCYFFFKDNDEQNDLATALCAILHQLFSQQPKLLQHAVPHWEKNGDKLQHEVSELWRILMAVTSDPASSKTICVLDALDECRSDDQERLIQRLGDFNNQAGSSTQKTWLKFLVTSRPYVEIQSIFQATTDSFPHIHLHGEQENEQIHKEIDIVVKIQVKELAERSNLSLDVQQRIEHQLLQMEHRTYLWLYLAIDDIHTMFRDSLRPAQQSIDLVPRSVNEAYKKILARVPSGQADIVKKILQIIVGARRPLTIEEMSMALGVATSPHSKSAATAGLDPVRLDDKIRRLCGLFVFINNSKIYLIHQTAREFLIGRNIDTNLTLIYSFNWRDIESEMSQICIRYLLMDDLENRQGQTKSDNQRFLSYSAEHWPDHVRGVTLLGLQEMENLLYKVYNTRTASFELWFSIFWNAVMGYYQQPKLDAVHLAALNGHAYMLQIVITTDRGTINQPDSAGTTPLIWASRNGHHEAVKTLLDNGADVNTQGGGDENALYAASWGGHDRIVQMLLDKGANINTQGGHYGNALQAASSQGHDKIVQMLLDKGANANAQGGHYGNVLQAACSQGHDKIVQLLLDKGADVNAQNKSQYYRNALQAASFGGYDKVVQMLLDKGADVNAQDEGNYYGNALQVACSQGHDKIVQMLLGKGADINAQSGHYGNAIQAAFSTGYDNIVQILLDKGTDVNAQNGRYENILQAACSQGHDKIVQLLLDKGANTNTQGGYYENALQVACSQGHDKVVQMLLDKGANANAQGGYYGNVLQAASYRGHDKIVQMLLDKGANANAQGGHYGNVLQAASFGGHDKIVQILLDKGADINAQGGYYGNALQAAFSRGYDNIVQILLDKGTDVNTQNGRYENILQAACSQGHDKIVQLLLDKGADINTQGGYYENALQAASYRGHDRIVQMLLDKGADVDHFPSTRL
ncbi:ankyrin repeat-containing domain protein [Aspergillus leporis]|uniref:Ankyrin repeat-containing domain protein n=1 Tax=Aspergillus leporis TaxID=41062 RepID=A0A5N5WI91_9EURO|nr:ankyrin repeat-containing domain protein [Aspergillus leporis]